MESQLRGARLRKGLSQTALAREVALSRQALHAMESGKSVPGVDVALRLASVLETTVESLFGAGASAQRVRAHWASGSLMRSGRVALAKAGGRWVAHGLPASDAQEGDGLVVGSRGRSVVVEPFTSLERAERRLLVMGCAPALGLLASRLGTEVPMTWLDGSSRLALDALAAHDVHVAGIHYARGDEGAGAIRKALPRTKVTRVTLAGWELGLVVSERNRRRIRGAGDLLKRGVKVAVREPGSGARTVLERALHAVGHSLRDLPHVSEVRGHLEVAQRVALGLADSGVTIGAAAVAHGLHFIPLVEEQFELVIPDALLHEERVERLVSTLSSRAFRSELSSLGGYVTE